MFTLHNCGNCKAVINTVKPVGQLEINKGKNKFVVKIICPFCATRHNMCYVNSRQIESLELLANGLNKVEVGAHLFLSHRTIEAHIEALKKAFGCKTTLHLVADALRLKIIN